VIFRDPRLGMVSSAHASFHATLLADAVQPWATRARLLGVLARWHPLDAGCPRCVGHAVDEGALARAYMCLLSGCTAWPSHGPTDVAWFHPALPWSDARGAWAAAGVAARWET
jgi:hypothetical protein